MQGKPWERYSNAPQPVAPPNPSQQFEAPKAQADAARAQAEAALATAQTPYAGQLAQAEAARAAAEAQKALAEAQGGAKTQAQQAEERDRVSRLNQLIRQINRVEQLYRAGPGSTSGPIESLADYIPSDANAALDVAGAQLSQQGLAAFRVPGTGTVSDRDAVMFDRGNLPTAATRDVANEEILRGLKARVEEELSSLGRPAPQWGRDPEAKRDEQDGPNAMTMLRSDGGGTGGGSAAPLADVGSGGMKDVSNPAADRAHEQLIFGIMERNGGRLDPQEYAQGLAALTREFDIPVADAATQAATSRQWATEINRYLDQGGTTVPTGLNISQVMSATDTMRNNLANNPVGGFASGSANMLTMGGLEALAPGQYQALGDAQPVFQTGGEIVGSIGGATAIGRGAGAVVGRVAPGLMQGGARGQVMRNIATDATYGAGYGGVTEGDPLSGAALGAIGSTAGQGIARALAAGVGGVQRSAAVEALRGRGVPVSVARQAGLGRVEDVMQSIPVVGDVSRARQMDSFVGFNEAAFREAGSPIGASIPNVAGRDGIEALDDAVGNAYNSALGGRAVPLDPQFGSDLMPASVARTQLPDDVAARADKLIFNHLDPLQQSGQLTGEMYQRARRGLGKARNNANQIAGEFDEPYREAMTGVLDAYDNLLMRGGGQDVIEGLNAANAANKNLRILEDASLNRAKVGTASGEVNVFTPAQLLASARKSEAKYGSSDGLRTLGEQGQQVLPSTVPNSGTTDRMLAVQALGGVGALGGGLGFAGDPTAQGAAQGTGTAVSGAVGAAGLLALLGSRRGQQALEQILFTRPQVAQRVGQGFRRRGGLFGSAGNVAAQEYGN